jgi:hypothetical protein
MKGRGNESIQSGTVTVGIPGKKRGKDREMTMLIPHVVKGKDGKLHKLSPAKAVARAKRTGDFAEVKNPKVGTRRSKKFSARLGKLSTKRPKR